MIFPALLAAAVLTADVVEVSKESAVVAPLRLPRVSRASPRSSQLPVPVFHPSIWLDALEVEIPVLEPLDIELLDRQLERSLAKKRIARAEEQPTPPKQPELAEEAVAEWVRANLIQVSGIQPHLLEIIRPRPLIDPEAVEGIPELFPPIDPWGPIGWPGVGWIDFPLDPNGGLKLVKPLPGAKKQEEDEEEDEPPQVIPEPGTATLLGLGLAVLGIARRRSSRNLVG